MSNILEINNWNQLTSARADNINLRIYVTQYNSEELIGTKIQIIDYLTNDIYLTLFSKIDASTIIPSEASLEPEEVVRIINLYGFNIRISYPIVLAEKVVSILQGLYDSGYRYVYKDYPNKGNDGIYVIYASKDIRLRMTGFNITKIPDFIEDEWDWCKPFKTYPIIDLLNGTVDNGLPI